MQRRETEPGFLELSGASIAIFLSLAGVVAGLTLLFLGMRSVMEVGGACADGGPYVPAQPCPDGVPLAMMGGIFGGLACLAVYVVVAIRYRVPNLVALAWPALFLSLGWNFLEYGLDPPFGDGVAWGWLVCAVTFGLMAIIPLVFVIGPTVRSFLPKDPQGPLTYRDASITLRPAIARIPPIVTVEGSPGGGEAFVSALERLARLRADGSLTETEFEDAKRRLLEGDL